MGRWAGVVGLVGVCLGPEAWGAEVFDLLPAGVDRDEAHLKLERALGTEVHLVPAPAALTEAVRWRDPDPAYRGCKAGEADPVASRVSAAWGQILELNPQRALDLLTEARERVPCIEAPIAADVLRDLLLFEAVAHLDLGDGLHRRPLRDLVAVDPGHALSPRFDPRVAEAFTVARQETAALETRRVSITDAPGRVTIDGREVRGEVELLPGVHLVQVARQAASAGEVDLVRGALVELAAGEGPLTLAGWVRLGLDGPSALADALRLAEVGGAPEPSFGAALGGWMAASGAPEVRLLVPSAVVDGAATVWRQGRDGAAGVEARVDLPGLAAADQGIRWGALGLVGARSLLVSREASLPGGSGLSLGLRIERRAVRRLLVLEVDGIAAPVWLEECLACEAPGAPLGRTTALRVHGGIGRVVPGLGGAAGLTGIGIVGVDVVYGPSFLRPGASGGEIAQPAVLIGPVGRVELRWRPAPDGPLQLGVGVSAGALATQDQGGQSWLAWPVSLYAGGGADL